MASGLMLTPLIALLAYPQEINDAQSFIIPSLVLFVTGFVFWRFFHLHDAESLTIQEGGVIVFISWTVVNAFCAFPFMLILKIDFARAVFESVSGWSTTGLSIVDVTTASRMVLLWRSILQPELEEQVWQSLPYL